MVKKSGDWWVDGNGNKWNCFLFSKEKSEDLSSGLWGCHYCINCSNCNFCRDCHDCHDCHFCGYCSNCNCCNYCRDCRGFKTRPCVYITPCIGSRQSQTTMYWLNDNVQIICGCFHGNLDEFESKVNEVHGDNEHGQAYRKQIAIMRMLISQDNE